MLKKCSALAAATLLGILAAPIHAADLKRGETLHKSQCVACHAARFGNNGAEIYTRNNRRVNNLPGLRQQVKRCRDNLEIAWFDEDIADVVEYLNHSYYQFEQ